MEKTCPVCGKIFRTLPSNKTIHCSYKCSGFSKRNRVVKICKTCGKKFETFPCRKNKNYCSAECYSVSKIKISGNKKKCVNCNKLKKITSFYSYDKSWCKSCSTESSKKSQMTPRGRYKYSINLARRRQINFEINMEDYINLVNLPCHYCSGKLSNKGVGLDRKENNKSYSLDNCVPCCPRCNYVKSWFLSYEEMVWLGKYLKELDDRKHII